MPGGRWEEFNFGFLKLVLLLGGVGLVCSCFWLEVGCRIIQKHLGPKFKRK